MITIISGSRRVTDFYIIQRAVDVSGFSPTKIIEGGQRTWDDKHKHVIGGIDWLAYNWATLNKIPRETIRAKWRTGGCGM